MSQGIVRSSNSSLHYPNGTLSSSTQPPLTHTLRDLLKQRKRRRLRKRVKIVLHIIVCRLIPLLMLIIGIIFCFIGGFYHMHFLLSIGCVLLICVVGLMLQSCFWSRSQPNKFTINEVIRVDTIEEDIEAPKGEVIDDTTRNSEKVGGTDEEGTSHVSPERLMEVRRLSMAMTRVASELRKSFGSANFARGPWLGGHTTNLAPTDYEHGAINWYGNFTSSELTHMRRLSQWQNFV
ncbi:unnamed protein product [Hymenolepis diminuta]|uniref:Transmembrane protein n=1 Tax=Hymenolepis diminuta TaxID=6216 RepID=A0A0R3SRF0_HYMDI|nr:unnamed protein product [Hymenolepis diminuta]VUZ42924.1 unnamed protein product [Hymenolepis diminuta]